MTRVKINKPRAKVGRATRQYYRTTILTTDRRSFARVKNLKEGETLTIECPNDIISSARGAQDNVHHSLRRVTLLRRALEGGYRQVKVRCEQGNEIYCVIDGRIIGDEDACSCKVPVRRGL